MTESVETLERIANPKKPPMRLSDMEEKRNQMNEEQDPAVIAALKAELKGMDEAYLSGRGNLDVWTPEIMAEIDEAFVDNFMEDKEPLDFLFFPNSPEYLNAYGVYLQAVDDILVKHQETLPKYCREYLTYYSIWEMRGYRFPVPIGTASAVECLHKIASERRKGFIEVSATYFIFCTVQDAAPQRTWHMCAAYRCESIRGMPRWSMASAYRFASISGTSKGSIAAAYRCESIRGMSQRHIDSAYLNLYIYT